MFGLRQYFTSKTKILIIGFLLILLPVAIVSYISLKSLIQKAENLKTKYMGTVSLIKDKLESDIIQRESNLRDHFIELIPEPENKTELQDWLDSIQYQDNVFDNLVLQAKEGGLLSCKLSLNWPDGHKSKENLTFQRNHLFTEAEKYELIDKNNSEAIRLYKSVLYSISDEQSRTVLHNRIGRCYLKADEFTNSIKEYNKILEFKEPKLTIGNIPASVAALTQITTAYDSLGVTQDNLKSYITLYRLILENPWDLRDGEYQFYLKLASDKVINWLIPESDTVSGKIIDELILRENDILREANHLDNLNQTNPSYKQHGFIKLPDAFENLRLSGLFYEFHYENILDDLFPEILTNIELGKDVIVGILDDQDNLMFSEQELSSPEYLVSESFSIIFENWRVALFDPEGKSIDKLVGNEKILYFLLFLGIIIVTIIGIFILVRAVNQEARINRMKSEFISNVSHELKTPLALIRMFGETLESGIVTEKEKQKEFYSIIRKESERLTHLVNNVLDFSRMDTGIKKYNFKETDLVAVVKSSVEAYQFHIRDMGFKIESEFPGNPIILTIDRDAISQSLLNLLSNAVKYSKEEKLIKIEVDSNNDSALISVTDKGIGIQKEELNKIFEKFYQVPPDKVQQSRGSGLGLTITKQIMEAHGGQIMAESQFGKGCTFTLILPLTIKEKT